MIVETMTILKAKNNNWCWLRDCGQRATNWAWYHRTVTQRSMLEVKSQRLITAKFSHFRSRFLSSLLYCITHDSWTWSDLTIRRLGQALVSKLIVRWKKSLIVIYRIQALDSNLSSSVKTTKVYKQSAVISIYQASDRIVSFKIWYSGR
jgi:hypothetical protein